MTATVDTIVLGRKLAQGFIPTWSQRLENPQTADDGARKMVETRKVVFTQTLAESEWAMTELAKGDLVEEITRLKNDYELL